MPTKQVARVAQLTTEGGEESDFNTMEQSRDVFSLQFDKTVEAESEMGQVPLSKIKLTNHLADILDCVEPEGFEDEEFRFGVIHIDDYLPEGWLVARANSAAYLHENGVKEHTEPGRAVLFLGGYIDERGQPQYYEDEDEDGTEFVANVQSKLCGQHVLLVQQDSEEWREALLDQQVSSMHNTGRFGGFQSSGSGIQQHPAVTY